jgi:hypothetical protein
MRIVKDIYYEALGITPENGWNLIYEWHFIRKIMRIINISIFIFTLILSQILGKQIIDNFNLVYGMIKKSTLDAPWYFYFIIISVLIIFFIFIITPIHELIHVIPFQLNVFSNKTWLLFGNGAASVHFDGEISKNREMISLVLPFIVLPIILVFVSTIVPKGISYLIYFLLYMSILGCYSDIMMFFYILIKLPRNCIIYGNRYKV